MVHRSICLPTASSVRALVRGGLAAGLAALAFVAVDASPAAAHVEASPAQVTAGAPSTIQLTVEEGCGKAPTIELRVKLPQGFGAASAPTGPDGWVGEQAADVLTFKGPAMPSDAAFVVGFTVTPDASVGGTIQPLPAVQLCDGVKDPTRWIDLPIAGQPEPEHPAALVTVLPAPAPTTVATTAAPTTVAPTTEAPTTVAATTAAPTSAPATTALPTTVAATTATTLAPLIAPKPPSGGSSGSTLAIVVGIVAALSAVGGFFLARRRSTANEPTPT